MNSRLDLRHKKKRNTIDMVEYPDIYSIIQVVVEGLIVKVHLSLDVFMCGESTRKMMY